MKEINDYFNTVYDATFRELARLCLLKAPAEDSKDILQNTYAKFYESIRRRGTNAVRDPKAYLIKVLKHEIARFHGSKGKLKALPLEAAENEPSADDVEELCLASASADEILSQLKNEPEITRRMFILRYGYGMKLSEIAREMGVTEAGVKSRLARVREKIGKKLN